MIDLRTKGLPDAIEVAGKPFSIKTDFRDWIKFSGIIESDEFKSWASSVFTADTGISFKDFFYLFKEEIPPVNFIPELMNFYINENDTPNKEYISADNVKTYDYIRDGEYIFGSFMQAYHIDLTECDMHWHKFKALFLCLPQESKINEIVGMRSWNERDEKRKYEEQRKRLRDIWRLPVTGTQVDLDILEEINDVFYNCV